MFGGCFGTLEDKMCKHCKETEEKLEFLKRNHYDPKRENEKCSCGHIYYRHFDTYDDMLPIGCKYCPCLEFKQKEE